MTEKEVNQVLDVLVAISTSVEIKFLWRPQLKDAADEMVLETAINGMADVIVTFNEKDFRPAPKLFCVSILQPKKALDRITL